MKTKSLYFSLALVVMGVTAKAQSISVGFRNRNVSFGIAFSKQGCAPAVVHSAPTYYVPVSRVCVPSYNPRYPNTINGCYVPWGTFRNQSTPSAFGPVGACPTTVRMATVTLGTGAY